MHYLQIIGRKSSKNNEVHRDPRTICTMYTSILVGFYE